jgi:ABC-type transporter Mla MlaB component
MVKITVVDGRASKRLVVEGKLVGPSVAELESAWNQARLACRGRVVVDLSRMTIIDSGGEAALLAMIGEGARLSAKGVYSEYIVEQLIRKGREVRAARPRKQELMQSRFLQRHVDFRTGD